jgi:hypothetical protein
VDRKQWWSVLEESSMTAATQGFYRSNLAPSYRCYERQHFMATLNDWDGFRRRGFDPFGGRANRRIETLLTRAPSRYFCSETPLSAVYSRRRFFTPLVTRYVWHSAILAAQL